MDIAFDRPSEDDIALVHAQLGVKKQKSLLGIAIRCPFGFPSVVVLDPLQHGRISHESISSPLWLSCPWLNYEIHELENKGYIKKINHLIVNNRDLLCKMMDSHANFYFLRKSLCRKGETADFLQKNPDFFNRGIGGIQNIMYIKCMHLHYAHYSINTLNIVGRITDGLLGNKNCCEDGYCICLKKLSQGQTSAAKSQGMFTSSFSKN